MIDYIFFILTQRHRDTEKSIKKLKSVFSVSLCLCVIIYTTLLYSPPVHASASIINHDLTVELNPSTNSISVTDNVTIPAKQLKPTIHFLLNGNLSIKSNTNNIKLINKKTSDPPVNSYILTIPDKHKGNFKFSLKYSGVINQRVEQQTEEYARSFSETSGIISQKGVYLAGVTYWIPWFSDNLITFNITTTLPKSWDALSQGNRTLHDLTKGNRIVRWESPEPMDEIFLIAAEFTEYTKIVSGVTTMALLRSPDIGLAEKYLETTGQYLEMYQNLIGPFPYKKFALVENFWETGYGMPSFTLLGSQIIRFPFILHSSYPHELLHNWWGNSVFVDYESGNWCEGLTVYMADHLIKEQRGQGAEYRRDTLKKYTDYVNQENDFPLNEFRSRRGSSTEAVGYGKSMMMWNMLRLKVGDNLFTRAIQKFYKDNKFIRASFDDIRKSFEAVTDMNLEPFFKQWVTLTGAPALRISKVKAAPDKKGFKLSFTISQTQKGIPYTLDIPVAIHLEDKKEAIIKRIHMKKQNHEYTFLLPDRPIRVDIDPQFDLFRKLHRNEVAPSLSKAFGSEKVLIILPSKASNAMLKGYKDLAETWAKENSDKIRITADSAINTLPKNQTVWLFGTENVFKQQIIDALSEYDLEIKDKSIRIDKTELSVKENSFIISARNPINPDKVIVFLTTDKLAAMPGLGRKLPHYGKYSYLAFEGNEPSNILKGQWPAVNSPLIATVSQTDNHKSKTHEGTLPLRHPLAKLAPLFSEKTMKKHVSFLANNDLEGRGLGSKGLDKAANYIVAQFKALDLQPGADNGTYIQSWTENNISMKNIIAIIPGVNKEWKEQSVIVSAHYDHLGLGWPDVHKGDEGKIHNGADDNASGVAVMMELAKVMAKAAPSRTIIFVAFTGEENGRQGSKYYLTNIKKFPSDEIMGVINLDTVGRLQKNKIMVIGAASAREWKHIFMGSGFVTGIQSSIVAQDIDSSDQVTFTEKGIPAVQIFSGPNKDYHRPSDTTDKIDFQGMVKVATFTREAIFYLAEREEPLTPPGKESSTKNTSPHGKKKDRQVRTGTIPDFSFSGKGVRIAEVSEDSPAFKAGLKEGDIIIQVGSVKTETLKEYSDVLKNYKPNDKVTFTYLRDKKLTSIEIILAVR